MKILELFSGYGTATFALKRIGVPHEVIGYSDIDNYANKIFQQNHGGKELGNVKEIKPEELEDFDLLTGGFPCQAFSVAGKGLGELDPRGTLFYEIIRIAEVKKPRYMLLENVKGLTNKNHRQTFEKILSELARIGYKVHWKVLNTKDYGIPQNRERVWFVCFREQEDYDKFTFPEKEELKIFIKDILEPEVDKKYYLSEKLQERFRKYLDDKESKIVAMRGRNPDNPSDRTTGSPTEQRLEFNENGISNSLTSVQKDNLVYDRKGFDSRTKGFRESEMSPCLSTKMGTGGNNVPMVQAQISPCITCELSKTSGNFTEGWIKKGFLRRLTPKECFRLQGFLNDEINLEGISDTQKYKLAGNGQSVNVVAKIFERMFK